MDGSSENSRKRKMSPDSQETPSSHRQRLDSRDAEFYSRGMKIIMNSGHNGQLGGGAKNQNTGQELGGDVKMENQIQDAENATGADGPSNSNLPSIESICQRVAQGLTNEESKLIASNFQPLGAHISEFVKRRWGMAAEQRAEYRAQHKTLAERGEVLQKGVMKKIRAKLDSTLKSSGQKELVQQHDSFLSMVEESFKEYLQDFSAAPAPYEGKLKPKASTAEKFDCDCGMSFETDRALRQHKRSEDH